MPMVLRTLAIAVKTGSVCRKQGCLVIFFSNFLALLIKAKVADVDSDGATAYSVGLIIVNIFFFLSIWGNTFATIKATFSRSHVQVCPAARLASIIACNLHLLDLVSTASR